MDRPELPSDAEPPLHWISAAEAARITGLSRQHVMNLIRGKTFTAVKNSAGEWRIDPTEVNEYAPVALERKEKLQSKNREHLGLEHRPEVPVATQGGQIDSLMQELSRLRARNLVLEHEIAYEQEATEHRRKTEEAWDLADKLAERARKAVRRARKQQRREVHTLEKRIEFLRGPRHPGDLDGEDGSAAP